MGPILVKNHDPTGASSGDHTQTRPGAVLPDDFRDTLCTGLHQRNIEIMLQLEGSPQQWFDRDGGLRRGRQARGQGHVLRDPEVADWSSGSGVPSAWRACQGPYRPGSE
jgi:hypothetical protein